MLEKQSLNGRVKVLDKGLLIHPILHEDAGEYRCVVTIDTDEENAVVANLEVTGNKPCILFL